MLKEQAKLLNRTTIFFDLSLVIISFVVAYYIRYFISPDSIHSIKEYSWVLLPSIPVWYYFLAKHKLYKSIRHITYFELFWKILSVHTLAWLTMSALILYFDRDFYSRGLFVSYVAISFIFIFTERCVLKLFLGFIRKKGHNYRQLLIVGAQERATQFIRLVEEHADWGLHIFGILQVAPDGLMESVCGYKVLGRLNDIRGFCKQHPIDEVVFCLSKDQVVDVEEYLKDLEDLGLTVRMVLDFYKLERFKKDLSFFGGTLPILTFHSKSLDSQQLFVKRILDIVGATTGFLMMLALFPLIAVGIKMGSPGPIFYTQIRVGESGRTFRIFKFRSMYQDADLRKVQLMQQNEMKGAIFKLKNDPRITPIGRFLRVTSLDEFPQFWNVLKGEMSLVGTRPPTPEEVGQYDNWHHRRISIKPGITGLWQVGGRSQIEDFDEVVKLDLQYIDNWNIGLDLRILLKTVWVVLTSRGSY